MRLTLKQEQEILDTYKGQSLRESIKYILNIIVE